MNWADAKQGHKDVHAVVQKHSTQKKQNGISEEPHINQTVSWRPFSEASTATLNTTRFRLQSTVEFGLYDV